MFLGISLLAADAHPQTEPRFVLAWGGACGSDPGLFDGAAGVAVDPMGRVYVADALNHRIQVFDADGGLLAIWGGIEGSGDGQFSYPEDVEVGPSGFVYVLERGNYRIQKFNASGGFVKKWGFLCVLPGDCDGGFSVPLSFALDVQENVYVVEWNHRVQKFDSEGNFISKWGTLGTGPGQFDHPNAICVDPSGDAYVGDRYGVQRFDADGNFILQLVRSDSPVYGVGSLAADQSGIIYVGDTERVRLYTRDGAFLLDWDGSDVPPVEDCLRDLPTRASKRESRTSSRLALLDIAFDSGQYIYATHQWGVLKFVRGPTPVTSTSWTAIKKAYRE